MGREEAATLTFKRGGIVCTACSALPAVVAPDVRRCQEGPALKQHRSALGVTARTP